jgi:hypothetical protein
MRNIYCLRDDDVLYKKTKFEKVTSRNTENEM